MKLNQGILDEWFVSEEEAEEVAVKELLIEKRIQYLKGWLAGHASDVSQLTPGLRKLVEISRGKDRGERNMDMDAYRKERWGRLLRKEVEELAVGNVSAEY